MEKRKIRLFALVSGIVSVISFIAAVIIIKNITLPTRITGALFAFPSACMITVFVALYVAKVWDKEDEDDE